MFGLEEREDQFRGNEGLEKMRVVDQGWLEFQVGNSTIEEVLNVALD